jgi:hypothetical protein
MYYYKVSVSLNSTSVTQGDDVTVNGSVLNDNSTTIGDYNVTLTVPTGTFLVPIDVNGNFSFVFNTTGKGTGQYEIRAEATAPNSISTNAVTYLSINAPGQATGGNNGGGGGGGGGSSNSGASAENAPSMTITANCVEDPITILTTRNGNLVSGAKITAKINNSIVAEATTDSSGTAIIKINEAGTIELTATASGYSSTKTITLVQCTPTENNNSNNNNNTNTGTNNSSNTVNTTNNNGNTNTEGTGTETKNNNAPTGFFGLGNNTPIVGGVLLLAIVGIGYFMFVIRKPF